MFLRLGLAPRQQNGCPALQAYPMFQNNALRELFRHGVGTPTNDSPSLFLLPFLPPALVDGFDWVKIHYFISPFLIKKQTARSIINFIDEPERFLICIIFLCVVDEILIV